MDNIIPNKYILVYGEGTYNDHWNDGKGDIRDDAIVFVVDRENGNAIYTHGHKFGGGSQNNESQNGGSSLPTDPVNDDPELKTVFYGFDVNPQQSNSISANKVTMTSTNSSLSLQYFYFKVPNTNSNFSFTYSGFGCPYELYANGELYSTYRTANAFDSGTHTFKIEFEA